MTENINMLQDTWEISELIDEIDRLCFETAKQIYAINFNYAQTLFIQIQEPLQRVFKYYSAYSQIFEQKQNLDIHDINRCLSQILESFGARDFQKVCDLMLYDLSSILNSFNDYLKTMLDQIEAKE